MQLDSDNYSSEEENTSGEESSKKANPEKKGKYIPPKLAAVPYGKYHIKKNFLKSYKYE